MSIHHSFRNYIYRKGTVAASAGDDADAAPKKEKKKGGIEAFGDQIKDAFTPKAKDKGKAKEPKADDARKKKHARKFRANIRKHA